MVKDKYHQLVRQCLENEGWTITHDPYKISIGKRRGYIDLGAARQIIAAEKAEEKIAVEIKSFSEPSDLDAFEDALGQFIIYWRALKIKEAERILYLAVPLNFYERFFDDNFFLDTAKEFDVKMIIFDELSTLITKWIK
ncbi:MAG: element excision factor XisH family protein [Microscillaceae bacterium]|nr:element excision factor XisH family protein [Microscillaceae bacterium]